MRLELVDPTYRRLVDQLFFTDRLDIDTSQFTSLFANKDVHYEYLWDRISRSREIFWDEAFWVNRFELLLTLNTRKVVSTLELILLSEFKQLLMCFSDANPAYNNAYLQLIAWTKARINKQLGTKAVEELLVNLIHFCSTKQILEVVKNFTPFVYTDVEEYIRLTGKNIAHSPRNFQVIKELEGYGFLIDKEPMFKLGRDLLLKRALNKPNRRMLFNLLTDQSVMTHLKSHYKPEHRGRLLSFVKSCEVREIEEEHLRNIKSLLELDPAIANDLFTIYAEKLYARGPGYQGANIKRLIRACKTFPQFSPKKALVWLSANKWMPCIQFLVSAFPDLKPLVVFA